MRKLLAFLSILSFSALAEQRLVDLQIHDPQNKVIDNCVPGGTFSFTAKGFLPDKYTRYDVIISAQEMITAKRISTIKAKSISGERVMFGCPNVKKTFAGYIKPSSSLNLNYSPKITFAGGIIPQIKKVEIMNGQLQLVVNVTQHNLTLHLNEGRAIPISMRANEASFVRLPREFTHGYVWVSNEHGLSAKYPVSVETEVPLYIKSLNINETQLLTYYSKEDTLVKLKDHKKASIQAGKMNKVSVYRIATDEQRVIPVIAGSSYYLDNNIEISPLSTAATKLYDSFDLNGISLEDKKGVYRYLLNSQDTLALAARYKEISAIPIDIFSDERSMEIITIVHQRLAPRINSIAPQESNMGFE